jgi:hypothetical protein
LPVFVICARLDYWFELPASSAQNFNLFIAMKRALIATLFNEADNVVRWWDCLWCQPADRCENHRRPTV